MHWESLKSKARRLARSLVRVLVVGVPDIADDDYFEAPADEPDAAG